MLVLEVINCPDPLVVGELRFFFSKLRIGRGQKTDLQIDDPSLKSIDLTLICEEDGVFIENKKSEFFLCNDKKFSGRKLLRLGDTFSSGKTSLKLKSYQYETINQPVSLENSYRDFIQNYPEQIGLLSSLEDKLKELDQRGL